MKNKIYSYKNEQYEVLYDDLEIKNPDSREWQKGVLYKQLSSQLLFVREKVEFENRFKVVE